MSVLFAMNISAQNCSELFFSEYVEGTDQNKAIEIYNPTSNTIDLSDYQIERYSNGSATPAGGITILSGMLAPGDVFVLTNGDTVSLGYGAISMTLYNMGDMAEPNGTYPTPMHMNGNDAIVLSKNGDIIDVFGRVIIEVKADVEFQLNLQSIPNGVYNVLFFNKEEVVDSRKIVVNK